MFAYKKILSIGSLICLAVFASINMMMAQVPAAEVRNVVLVHGAFADGSSWIKVIPLLHAKGIRVIAVHLPLTSLLDDVAATKRAIALMNGPVVLVGHSWAGMVITEAGNDPQVEGLVYISALIPDDGEAVVDLGKSYPTPPGSAEIREDGSGFLYMTEKGMNEHFVPDLTRNERRHVHTTQGPWAKKALGDKVSKASWKQKPSWVIVDTEDRMVSPDLQREQATKIKATTIELKSGHVPLLSHPEEVAAFIVQAIQQASTSGKK